MDRCLDGMVLAATIADDPLGREARGGLEPALAADLEARLGQLAAVPATVRREAVRDLTRSLTTVHEEAALPPRAAALLAKLVPREVGRRWLAAAPVRRGYRASPGLRAAVRRAALPDEPDAERAERDAARSVDVALSPARAASLRRWADHVVDDPSDADAVRRALGALTLGVLSSAREQAVGGDGRSRGWRRLGREIARAWALPWRGDGA